MRSPASPRWGTEAQLSAIEELGRIGLWEWDFAAGRATWSPASWRLHGLPPRDGHLPLGEALDAIDARDRGRILARLGAKADGSVPLVPDAATSGAVAEFDYRTAPRDGPPLSLHARARIERDAAGRLVRVVGTAQDVTTERREEGMREVAFLASIVESSADAIVTKDTEGTITSWNRAAQALFGHEARQAVGRREQDLLLPPGLEDAERRLLERVRRGHRVRSFETVRLAKGGRPVDVSLALAPLRDRTGRVVGSACTYRDISEQKRRREREREAMDAEIRRLDEMQRFRARFLNIAAHELKTPLTPIRLQLQLLQLHLRDQPQPVLRSLDILSRSVERLRSLMDDVLDAARVQATQLKLRLEPLDLEALMREALETYASVAREADVALRLDVGGPVRVLADQTRLLQVANNLLSNALKFTPAGGAVDVVLRAEQGWARLEVSDSGRGLSADQRERLFQPFMQVHADLESAGRGSGLGLFIVKAIVEQHGGRIGIESPGPGQGTRVTVLLPLEPGEARDEAAPTGAGP